MYSFFTTRSYSGAEIDFLLLCCDQDHEGNIDYGEFSGRFLVRDSKSIIIGGNMI